MTESVKPAISVSDFRFDQVDPKTGAAEGHELRSRAVLAVNPTAAATNTAPKGTGTVSAPLGDLIGFTNPEDVSQGMVFAGNGFNTIFRPQSSKSTAPLPVPVPTSDNILELNLTSETMSFSAPLGNVPNRGANNQADIFLNGVPYVQVVNDITPGTAVGIHFETGMWMAVPPTSTPSVAQMTYARLASVPHGVAINAQGLSHGKTSGAPNIPPVNINPFFIGQGQQPPSNPVFLNQTATNQGTARIPQDLTSFIAAGTITQAMIDDPNTVLRKHLAGLTVESFVELVVTTDPAGNQPTPPLDPTNPPVAPVSTSPGNGGGTAQIGFQVGATTEPMHPNANAFKVIATYYIERIKQKLVVPPCKANGQPVLVQPPLTANRPFLPTFALTPPADITANKTIEVFYTQIQYSQTVFFNFGPISWPHVSVATLIPAAPIAVPAGAWV